MFLKAKIYFTIFSIYEMLTVLLLHSPKACNSLFSMWFCQDSILKYFLFCVVLPLSLFLIFMWVSEIRKAIRRRRSFMYQAKERISEVASSIKDTIKANVISQDMEVYLAALAMSGLKRYMDRHPDKQATLEEFLGSVSPVEEEKTVSKKSKKK